MRERIDWLLGTTVLIIALTIVCLAATGCAPAQSLRELAQVNGARDVEQQARAGAALGALESVVDELGEYVALAQAGAAGDVELAFPAQVEKDIQTVATNLVEIGTEAELSYQWHDSMGVLFGPPAIPLEPGSTVELAKLELFRQRVKAARRALEFAKGLVNKLTNTALGSGGPPPATTGAPWLEMVIAATAIAGGTAEKLRRDRNRKKTALDQMFLLARQKIPKEDLKVATAGTLAQREFREWRGEEETAKNRS